MGTLPDPTIAQSVTPAGKRQDVYIDTYERKSSRDSKYIRVASLCESLTLGIPENFF